jgi:phosphomannomutase
VFVAGGGASNRALRTALKLHGVSAADRRVGCVTFDVSHDGRALRAEDENGRDLDTEQTLLLTALAEFDGGKRALAVTYDAPDAIDGLARDMGCVILRTPRDGARADELAAKCPSMRDGVASALAIYALMARTGETLSRLMTRLPEFRTDTREVPVTHGRGAVMRALGSLRECADAQLDMGLRLDTPRGTVHIAPSRERSALRIRCEGASEEIAEELMAEYERYVKRADEYIQN